MIGVSYHSAKTLTSQPPEACVLSYNSARLSPRTMRARSARHPPLRSSTPLLKPPPPLCFNLILGREQLTPFPPPSPPLSLSLSQAGTKPAYCVLVSPCIRLKVPSFGSSRDRICKIWEPYCLLSSPFFYSGASVFACVTLCVCMCVCVCGGRISLNQLNCLIVWM